MQHYITGTETEVGKQYPQGKGHYHALVWFRDNDSFQRTDTGAVLKAWFQN